jgi:hypothetical protein
MNGPVSPIERLLPVVPLTPEILPCSVLMDGSVTPIEPLFPVVPLTP